MQICYTPKDINRVNLLVDLEKYDQKIHQCMICRDLITNPIQCINCHTFFCSYCALKWKENYNICPKKCSEPWITKRIDKFNIPLRCPFSSECHIKLHAQNLKQHSKQCLHLPSQLIQQIEFAKNYLCKKSHQLVLYTQKYVNLSQLQCQQCYDKTLCRSYCPDCKKFYCITCRPLKITKGICPLNMHIYLRKFGCQNLICNVCGMKPYFLKRYAYDDMDCNISICEECYQNLPETSQPTLLINSFAQIDYLKAKDTQYLKNIETQDYLKGFLYEQQQYLEQVDYLPKNEQLQQRYTN